MEELRATGVTMAVYLVVPLSSDKQAHGVGVEVTEKGSDSAHQSCSNN